MKKAALSHTEQSPIPKLVLSENRKSSSSLSHRYSSAELDSTLPLVTSHFRTETKSPPKSHQFATVTTNRYSQPHQLSPLRSNQESDLRSQLKSSCESHIRSSVRSPLRSSIRSPLRSDQEFDLRSQLKSGNLSATSPLRSDREFDLRSQLKSSRDLDIELSLRLPSRSERVSLRSPSRSERVSLRSPSRSERVSVRSPIRSLQSPKNQLNTSLKLHNSTEDTKHIIREVKSEPNFLSLHPKTTSSGLVSHRDIKEVKSTSLCSSKQFLDKSFKEDKFSKVYIRQNEESLPLEKRSSKKYLEGDILEYLQINYPTIRAVLNYSRKEGQCILATYALNELRGKFSKSSQSEVCNGLVNLLESYSKHYINRLYNGLLNGGLDHAHMNAMNYEDVFLNEIINIFPFCADNINYFIEVLYQAAGDYYYILNNHLFENQQILSDYYQKYLS